MKALFHTFPALLKEFGQTEEVCPALVFAAWRRIAGELLADHTEPIGLDKKRLVIAVSDITWKRHLEDLSGQMIFKLNAVLGSETVTFLEFRVDAKELEKNRCMKSERVKATTNVKSDITSIPELFDSARIITDDGLRSSFLLAAASCLERKERLKISDRT